MRRSLCRITRIHFLAFVLLAFQGVLVSGGVTGSAMADVGTPGASSVAMHNSIAADQLVLDRLSEARTGADVEGTITGLGSLAPIQLGIADELAQLGSAVKRMPERLAQSGGWFRGIGAFLSARGQGVAPGYYTRSGGFLAGIDRRFGDGLTLGAAAGFAHSDLTESGGGSGTVETPRVIVYGGYQSGHLALDAGVGLAYHRIHAVRPVAALSASAAQSHNGFEETAGGQANYILPMRGLTLAPLVGLHFAHLSENRFAEAGAGGFDLANAGNETDSLQATVGANAFTSFVTDSDVRLRPAAKLTLGRELLGTSRILAMTTAGGGLTEAQSASPARTTLTLGSALAAQMPGQLALYADYQLQLGLGKSVEHDVFVGTRWQF
jgi:outer membrane autotransporter protein